MLLRFLIAAALVGLIAWLIKRVATNRPPLEATKRSELEAISRSELKGFERLAESAPVLDEVLHLRAKILELAHDERIAESVDTLVREIARELENDQRIKEALEEIEDTKLGEQLTYADDALRAAKDADAKRLAEGTIERLIAVRDARDKLRKRREEISTRAKHLALELRTAQLSLLEATSSAGTSAERVGEIRARLRQACEEAQHAAVAEEEVAKLIARGTAEKH